MTFKNCRFNGVPSTTNNAGFPYISAGGSPQPTKVTFIDCEFAGNGVEQQNPNGNLTLGWAHSLPCNVTGQTHIRSNIWGFQDGLHGVDNARYESCYIHDLTFFYSTPSVSTHNDGFQFVGDANDFALIGNNIDVTSPGTSAVWQYNGGSTRQRVTIANNWFNGGGYYMISGAPDVDEDMSVIIADNRFGLEGGSLGIWYPHPGWPDALSDGRLTLRNNVWDESGTNGAGQAVVAGSIIPEPSA
jgi:hypothetical protein